jgi:hypothetical protein
MKKKAAALPPIPSSSQSGEGFSLLRHCQRFNTASAAAAAAADYVVEEGSKFSSPPPLPNKRDGIWDDAIKRR